MSGQQDIDAIALLVTYRASLLVPGPGRAGLRLPGLTHNQRLWCFHSRNRRDFVLLILAAKINRQSYQKEALLAQLDISRNTPKTILDEAQSLDMLAADDGDDIRISEAFYDDYMRAYMNEWELLDNATAQALAKTFDRLVGTRQKMSYQAACEKMLQITVLSRAASVKSDRDTRLTPKSSGETLDLSSWVVMTSFNRDLLLLVMAAAIAKTPTNVTKIMASLHASRNAIKSSLRVAVETGLIMKQKSGYWASDQVLAMYLQWHLDVFAGYDKQLLSATALVYETFGKRDETAGIAAG
jgi:hypothetical protein